MGFRCPRSPASCSARSPASITTLATLFIIMATLAGVGQRRGQRPERKRLGHVHHRGDDPRRAVDRAVDVQDSARPRRRGLAHRRQPGAAGRDLGQAIRRFRPAAIICFFSKPQLSIILPVYAAIASILPVWVLLCPRDYLSSYMKIGVIAVLAVGIFVAHPTLAHAGHHAFHRRRWAGRAGHGLAVRLHRDHVRGPVGVSCPDRLGHHAQDDRQANRTSAPIGYGGMLLEGFVSVMALVAACALEPGDYFKINIKADRYAAAVERCGEAEHGMDLAPKEFDALQQSTGKEHLAGKTGGAVTLAVGMAKIFSSLPGMKRLTSYWYHFVIMFEALFILTLLETGTRASRFILEEAVAPFRRRRQGGRQPNWS